MLGRADPPEARAKKDGRGIGPHRAPAPRRPRPAHWQEGGEAAQEEVPVLLRGGVPRVSLEMPLGFLSSGPTSTAVGKRKSRNRPGRVKMLRRRARRLVMERSNPSSRRVEMASRVWEVWTTTTETRPRARGPREEVPRGHAAAAEEHKVGEVLRQARRRPHRLLRRLAARYLRAKSRQGRCISRWEN